MGKTCSCCSKEKEIKVYICPKCKSVEVGYILGFKNIFGIIPRMRCKKCKFEAMTFPLIVIDEKHLNKLNKKKISKKRNR